MRKTQLEIEDVRLEDDSKLINEYIEMIQRQESVKFYNDFNETLLFNTIERELERRGISL